MKIIKRSGREDAFDEAKIVNAVAKANASVGEADRLSDEEVRAVGENVAKIAMASSRALSVEEIQDLVENEIMAHKKYRVARNYITYRYTRELARKANTTDDRILSLIECNNEEVKQEKSL